MTSRIAERAKRKKSDWSTKRERKEKKYKHSARRDFSSENATRFRTIRIEAGPCQPVVYDVSSIESEQKPDSDYETILRQKKKKKESRDDDSPDGIERTRRKLREKL